MADPLHELEVAAEPLALVHGAAAPYLASLATRPVVDPGAVKLLEGLGGALPEAGTGGRETVERLLGIGTKASTASSGPRFFHFVTGGATPAALAADWTAALLDQNAFARISSPFAHEAETVAIDWLRQLVGLPEGWGGALVGSATFANFTSLATATHWWAERHGVDVVDDGLVGLPRMPVLSSGYVHPSSRKALQMLGHGRNTVEVFARDRVGRIDLKAMKERLRETEHPVIIANAGEVNAGDFDPVEDLAELAERHGAWLHVDGAFGLFAAVSPRSRRLTAGIERADSITADGHKWLNVPYESGFALIREPERLGRAFGMPGAPYLPGPDPGPAPAEAGASSRIPNGGYGLFGPESSRRSRALPIWATLAAYGRTGYRELIERHLDLAQYLANTVDEAPELERLAEVPLCIVCFRARPHGVRKEDLDDFNRKLGADLLHDGRVFAGTTVYDGKVALRPAIVNWRTTATDVDAFVAVVRELISRRSARP